jgi:hypothetical protein
MVQAVIVDRFRTRCHRLDALAIPRTNQTSDIGRAHPTPRLVAQSLQIRLKPTLEIPMPILFHRQPPSKLAPYESRISRTGNPRNRHSAKVVLGQRTASTVARNGAGHLVFSSYGAVQPLTSKEE